MTVDTPYTPMVSEMNWFPRFKDLPPEIQAVIWHEAIPGPRIVYVQYEEIHVSWCTRVWSEKEIQPEGSDDLDPFFDIHELDEDGWDELRRDEPGERYGPESFDRTFRPATPAPALLLACHDSRQVALEYYTQAFGRGNHLRKTWFDFERDVLYLDWDTFNPYSPRKMLPEDFWEEEASRIKHLATYDFPRAYGWRDMLCSGIAFANYEEWLCDILLAFKHLKKLTIVTAQAHELRDKHEELCFHQAADYLPSVYFNLKFAERPYTDSLMYLHQFMFQNIPFVNMEKLEEWRTCCIDKASMYGSGILKSTPR